MGMWGKRWGKSWGKGGKGGFKQRQTYITAPFRCGRADAHDTYFQAQVIAVPRTCCTPQPFPCSSMGVCRSSLPPCCL